MKQIVSSHHERGFSILELLTVVLLATTVTGIAVLNLREFSNPLIDGTAQLTSFLKQVRAQAISSTSAYTIRAESATRIITEQGTTCDDPATVPDLRRVLDLPDETSLLDTTWSICFNSRGFPDANLEIGLRDETGAARTIEVLLGGAVRIQ